MSYLQPLPSSTHFALIGRQFTPPLQTPPSRTSQYVSRASFAARLLSSISRPYGARVSSVPHTSSPLTVLDRSSSMPPSGTHSVVPTVKIPAFNLIPPSGSAESNGHSAPAVDVDAYSTPVVRGPVSSDFQPSFTPAPRLPGIKFDTRAKIITPEVLLPPASPTIAVLRKRSAAVPDVPSDADASAREPSEEQEVDQLESDSEHDVFQESRASNVASDVERGPQSSSLTSATKGHVNSQGVGRDDHLHDDLSNLNDVEDDSDDVEADPSYQSLAQEAADKAHRSKKQDEAWEASMRAVGVERAKTPSAARARGEDDVTTGFDSVDSTGESDGEDDHTMRKGKQAAGSRGPPSKEAIADCEAFGEATRAAADALCAKHGLKLQTVMTRAGLGLRKTMAVKNLPNALRQVWADDFRKNHPGSECFLIDLLSPSSC